VVQGRDRTKDPYHLLRNDSTSGIAHIVSDLLTPAKVCEEGQKGHRVQPCFLWISDPTIAKSQTDMDEWMFIIFY